MPNDYIDRKLAEFIAEHEGQEIDLTGAYGPQSPDLIAAYVQALLGDEWHFEYPYAVDLWADRRGSMGHDFERVEGQPQRGDIAVFDRTHFGVGTVGAVMGKGDHPGTIKVFTQNPGQARPMNLPTATLLGAWRLTAGAECVAVATEYAARHGYTPTCPPGDLRDYADWMKPADDPGIRPGDIVTFGLNGVKHGRPSDYGHVEVVGSRPSWFRVLFGWLRGNR